MRYVTSVEKIGIEKGIEQGLEKAAINLLKEGLPKDIIMKTTGIDLQKIQLLQKQISKQQ